MQLKQALLSARQKLSACGIESSSLDAKLILSFVTSYTNIQLISHDDEDLSEDVLTKYFSLIDKRATGSPTAYILGYKDFWSLTLKVNESTLIPRPDTETLVQAALDINPKGKVLDLGTGSGAIILSIKTELQDNIEAFACDYSKDALEVARENADKYQLKVDFRHSNWFSSFENMKFSMIVSNPPYIEEHDENLSKTSLPFEPINALTSGVDGLDDIRVIAKESLKHLEVGGSLLLEHGYNQGQAVRDILENHGFKDVKTIQDLENRDRVTLGFYKG